MIWSSLNRARNETVRSTVSTSYIHTTSASGSWRPTVVWVEVSAPKSGMVVDAAQSRDGSIDTKCTARVSPGSAPSMWKGPVSGFTNGNSMTRGDQVVDAAHLAGEGVLAPQLQHGAGLHPADGGTPPKVQASSWSSGR